MKDEISIWKLVFAVLSILGFLFSLIINLLTFVGIEISDYIPQFWYLHVGLFLVSIPIIILSRSNKDGSEIFSDIRKWAQILILFLVFYAVGNFIYDYYLTNGYSIKAGGGQFVLHNHGRIIRQLTEAEYNRLRLISLGWMSAIWMLFYFAAFSYYALKPNKI